MRLFKKVAIVGVGLIGGSIALALKKNKLAKEIVGISRHKKNIFLAKKRGVIDDGSQGLGIVKNSDLVIFATPVNTIITQAPMVSKIVGKGCIVTDVGSTKKDIVLRLHNIFPNYVGSHPLAGSEKRGVYNANANIFKGSICLITPLKNTNKKALNTIDALWKKIGAKTIRISAFKHDEILSFVSHLPHIAAFSLINSVPLGYLKLASSGLKDTTRIALSDSQLWSDIILSNKNNILKSIGIFEDNLCDIKKAVKAKDARRLKSILRKGKNKRDSLL